MNGEKQFIILGNINAITYKEVFPYLKENEIWLGYKSLNQDMYFNVTDEYKRYLIEHKKEGSAYKIVDGVVMGRLASACWFTNIDHGKRHEKLLLDTGKNNLRFNKILRKRFESDYGIPEYRKYENYDAIEIPFVECIPSDYDGVMGVPITFMDKYNPEQFEILGTSDNGLVPDEYKITDGLTQKFVDDYYAAGGKGAYKEGNPTAGIYKNGIASMIYKRIFIRAKRG